MSEPEAKNESPPSGTDGSEPKAASGIGPEGAPSAKGAELVIEDSEAAQRADQVASYAPVEKPPSLSGAIMAVSKLPHERRAPINCRSLFTTSARIRTQSSARLTGRKFDRWISSFSPCGAGCPSR